jgi:hypothetical protein
LIRGLLAHGFKASNVFVVRLGKEISYEEARYDYRTALGAWRMACHRQHPNRVFVVPGLKPAVANAIDLVTGYVPPAEPSLRVTHECRYLDPAATQCWSHLKIVSLNEDPITIERVVVNGGEDCTSGGFQPFFTLMAALFINVNNKTLNQGDAFGIGLSCEPVDVKIVTDKGTWSGGWK